MQIKLTTTIAGQTHESLIAVPVPEGEGAEAFRANSAILHAVGGAINVAMQQRIERITVEVVG